MSLISIITKETERNLQHGVLVWRGEAVLERAGLRAGAVQDPGGEMRVIVTDENLQAFFFSALFKYLSFRLH